MDARRAFGQGRLWFLAAGIVLLLFVNSWSVGMTLDRNPGLKLEELGKTGGNPF